MKEHSSNITYRQTPDRQSKDLNNQDSSHYCLSPQPEVSLLHRPLAIASIHLLLLYLLLLLLYLCPPTAAAPAAAGCAGGCGRGRAGLRMLAGFLYLSRWCRINSRGPGGIRASDRALQGGQSTIRILCLSSWNPWLRVLPGHRDLRAEVQTSIQDPCQHIFVL